MSPFVVSTAGETGPWISMADHLADKASAVAEAVERCAAACDTIARRYHPAKTNPGAAAIAAGQGAAECAAAIRARGAAPVEPGSAAAMLRARGSNLLAEPHATTTVHAAMAETAEAEPLVDVARYRCEACGIVSTEGEGHHRRAWHIGINGGVCHGKALALLGGAK